MMQVIKMILEFLCNKKLVVEEQSSSAEYSVYTSKTYSIEDKNDIGQAKEKQ